MEPRTLLILGAAGAAAWFFFFRKKTDAGAPITQTDPAAASGMLPGAAATTQVPTQAIVRSIASTRDPFDNPRTTGYPRIGSVGGFWAGALTLTGQDNNPVPTPPAAPNAFTVPWLGRPPISGTGSGSTGPNPTIAAVRTNPYSITGSARLFQ